MSLTGKIEDDNIPLADDDPQAIINEDSGDGGMANGRSMDSLRSSYTNSSSNSELDNDINPDDKEEKARLISQVLELQNTLDDLAQRVDSVKEENLKLKSENQVLGQYIENLMSASSVFQSTSPNTKKK
ncbi:short coiled-coil protein B [Bradysia coprophila]|uniref:short coiled-coil protein B n=1 Tax=Bradysia coprophila TaxID=38358 RepID=UPI00187D8693|nr:short coiled-coil protein B [Bradysia coprophila]